jgi:hypothetical protein
MYYEIICKVVNQYEAVVYNAVVPYCKVHPVCVCVCAASSGEAEDEGTGVEGAGETHELISGDTKTKGNLSTCFVCSLTSFPVL